MTRPTWDNYFIDIARMVAQRSTCDRAQVGCVLVRDNRILTTGYNGSVTGLGHCDELGHMMVDGHCIRTLHAEQNAIIQAALHGISTRGSTAYITHFPCVTCIKMLINAGVDRVAYFTDYNNSRSDEFFRWAKIQLDQLKVGE